MAGILFAVFASVLGASLIRALTDWKTDPPKSGGSLDQSGGSGDLSYGGDGGDFFDGGHGDCSGGGHGDCGGGGHH
jgi:hypothetical protein